MPDAIDLAVQAVKSLSVEQINGRLAEIAKEQATLVSLLALRKTISSDTPPNGFIEIPVAAVPIEFKPTPPVASELKPECGDSNDQKTPISEQYPDDGSPKYNPPMTDYEANQIAYAAENGEEYERRHYWDYYNKSFRLWHLLRAVREYKANGTKLAKYLRCSYQVMCTYLRQKESWFVRDGEKWTLTEDGLAELVQQNVRRMTRDDSTVTKDELVLPQASDLAEALSCGEFPVLCFRDNDKKMMVCESSAEARLFYSGERVEPGDEDDAA